MKTMVWFDITRIAVFPTLDPDTIAARKERARQFITLICAKSDNSKRCAPISIREQEGAS
jgi:hypothetical protein